MPRAADRLVLDHFGVDESALLGSGGEACVYALDDERVLRLPHPGTSRATLAERRALLDRLPDELEGVALPRVLDQLDVAGRTVVVEGRLPGADARVHLDADGTDRAALIRHHLDVCRALGALISPHDAFGSFFSTGVAPSVSFAEWSRRALSRSLAVAGEDFARLDPGALTDALVAALLQPDPARARLVHLDAFLGNMLAAESRITALLDFGPTTIGGPPDLDALVAIAYLAAEITPTADDGDREVAARWAVEHGLAAALDAAERWIAAFWTGALDDQRLDRWCRRILL